MEEARKAKALSEYLDALLQGESRDAAALGEEIEALGELGRSLADIELEPRPAHRAAVERLLVQYRPALRMIGPAVARTIFGMSPRWFFALLVLLVGSILASVVGGLVVDNTFVTEREMLSEPILAAASPSPTFTLEVASTLPSTPAVPVAMVTVSPQTPAPSLTAKARPTVVEDLPTVPPVATARPTAAEDQTPALPLAATPTPVVVEVLTPALPLAATPTPVVVEVLTPALPLAATPTPVVSEDQTPAVPSVATATPTPVVSEDQTPAVPSVATATPTPVVAEDQTPAPDMPEMPDLAFYPARLDVGGECRQEYVAQGSLRNHGPGLATNLMLDYVVVNGGDWVREVVVGPREWEELGASVLATFSVHVYVNEEWPTAGEGATIEVRLFVVGDELGEHRLAEATFAIHNQCAVTEPEVYDLAFYPAYLDAGGECRQEYVAQGSLENRGPGLATGVAIDHEVVSGIDWVREVLIEPQEWGEIGTDAPGRFSVAVRTDEEYWPTAGEGATIVVRLFVVGGEGTAEAFFTVHNQCAVAEPEVYDLAFYPAYLDAGGECRIEYVAQGSLENHGPGLATDVAIDHEVVSGIDWVQEVVVEPSGWREIGTDTPGRFSVTVRTDEEYWPTAREGATIVVRLFVVGGEGTAEAFFTVHNQCRVAEPEVYDLAFYPAHLNAGGECRIEYVAQGSLKNHGPGLATDVAIVGEVVSGIAWVREVVVEPHEWEEIETDKPGRFSVTVLTDEKYWPKAREGSTIEVRLYAVVSGDTSAEDALAEAFFTVHNQCESEEPKEPERME
jgi:hypothetical protein